MFIFFNFNFLESINTLSKGFKFLSMGIAFIGIIIIFLGIVNLGFSKTEIIKKGDGETLYFKGIYRYIKHPVYIGIFYCLFGFALYIQSPLSILISILILVVFYFKSKIEDKELEKLYDFYKIYNKNTGRFFPKIRKSN